MSGPRAGLVASLLLLLLLSPSPASADEDATIHTLLTADQWDRVATARTFQDLALQVAGVVDVDGRGNPQIRGGNLTMNRYYVDGVEITDPVDGGFGARLDFTTLSAVDVLTAGLEARYDALGGALVMRSDEGGDRLRTDGSVYLGFAGGAQDYQANLAASGPLVKRRLWYSVALQYDHGDAGGAGARRNDGVIGRLKLTWAPATRQRVTLLASADPSFVSSGATPTGDRQSRGGVIAGAGWDWDASTHLAAHVQLGFQYHRADSDPDGDFARARHVNLDDGSAWFAGGDRVRDRRWAVQIDPALALHGTLAGRHDAELGLQTRIVGRDASFARPGGASYDDRGGGPGASGLCNEVAGGAGCFQRSDANAATNRAWGAGAGVYLQDRWQPWRRLTLLPGLRVDWGVTRNSVGQTVSNLWGVGPRLGAVGDLSGDGRTLFRIFYGRANETLSLLPATRADATPALTTLQWNAATGRFEPLSASGGPGGYVIDRAAATPHSDELTVGLSRDLFGLAVAGVDYTYKKISNIWDGVEENQIWNPAGTRVVGFVDGSAHQVFRVTTPDGNWRTYQGVSFVLASRRWRRLDLYAAYTLSWLYGPGVEELGAVSGSEAASAFYNPRRTPFVDGFLPEDVRHVVKLRASYVWGGFTAGALLRYASNDGADVDVRAAYDFHALLTRDGRQHLALVADAFDLFNRSVQQPFRFQLGLRYTY